MMWYVVTNPQGLILAVYGWALENEAKVKARELNAASPGTELRTLRRKVRPSVCTTIPKRGTSAVAY